jgi:hypothetical protein
MKLTIFHIASSFFTIKSSYNGLSAPRTVFAVFRRTTVQEELMIDWCLTLLSAIFQLCHGDQF